MHDMSTPPPPPAARPRLDPFVLRQRWSSDSTAEALPGAAGARVIPGMPVNLSQEQIQETLVLQMRLQQVSAGEDDQEVLQL